MAEQKPKDALNKTKEFMQLWMKFHQLYEQSMDKTAIDPEEEKAFLETKSIIARKFQTLSDSMPIDRLTIDRTYDILNQILSLKSISTMSEHTLKKIENDWHQSYISLNRLLGHLEAAELSPPKKDIHRTGAPFAIPKGVVSAFSFIIFLLIVVFILQMLGIHVVQLLRNLINQ